MSVPEDESGRDAWIYELIHRGHRGDVAFYRRVCRGAERVLELGCGYGRLLLPVAEVARHVVGLERHPGLLARVRTSVAGLAPAVAARVAIVEGDMRGPLPTSLGPFDRILLPYNGLFCLASHAEKLACLAAARAVAAPDARLYLDAYVIDEESLLGADEAASEAVSGASGGAVSGASGGPVADEFEHVLRILAPEGRIDVFEQNVEYPGQSRIDAHFRLVLTDEAGGERVLTHSIEHHFLRPTEMVGVLEAAGWHVVSLAGGWRGGRFTARSPLMVVTCAPAPP